MKKLLYLIIPLLGFVKTQAQESDNPCCCSFLRPVAIVSMNPSNHTEFEMSVGVWGFNQTVGLLPGIKFRAKEFFTAPKGTENRQSTNVYPTSAVVTLTTKIARINFGDFQAALLPYGMLSISKAPYETERYYELGLRAGLFLYSKDNSEALGLLFSCYNSRDYPMGCAASLVYVPRWSKRY